MQTLHDCVFPGHTVATKLLAIKCLAMLQQVCHNPFLGSASSVGSDYSLKSREYLVVAMMYWLMKLLFGQVKGTRPSGRPRLSYNDVASSDCHECRITRPYKDAQNRLLWRDKTCPART